MVWTGGSFGDGDFTGQYGKKDELVNRFLGINDSSLSQAANL